MSGLKLPGRALLLVVTQLLFPAGGKYVVASALMDEKEIQLTFDVRWYRSPTLFITMDCLERHSKQFGQLFLGLAEFLSRFPEFVLVHVIVPTMLFERSACPKNRNRKSA
jgi:hypothetical protein